MYLALFGPNAVHSRIIVLNPVDRMSRGYTSSYDTERPDSGFEEGASKIKTLQSTVDENALERTQLELEIVESKEERAQRKSHSGHANFAFQHATEVDSGMLMQNSS